MATYEELMRAARNADAAGDATAARRLLELAMPQAFSGQSKSGSYDPGASIPRADDRGEYPNEPRIDTFGPTIRAATEDARAQTRFFAGRTVAPDRSVLQRAGDAALTGLSALGEGVAYAAGAAGEVFGGDPGNEIRLARDLMMGTQVAVPELAGVSSATRAAGAANRAAETIEAGPRNPQQTAARAADDLGITPSLGMTGKTGAQGAALLEKLPASAAIVARDAERAVRDTETAFRRITGQIGRARGSAEAGEQLQESLKGFVNQFENSAEELYRVVDAYIPADQPISLDRSASTLARTLDLYGNNPELARLLGVDKWGPVIREAQSNGIPWQAARDLRTRVGAAIGGRGDVALADKDLGDLKRLYADLTADLEAAAKASGPRAANAWGRATRYYSAGRKRIDEALDKTITAQSPERAFEAFDRMMREGSSADIGRVRRIRASMSRDDWGDVSASIVDRLGKATAGNQNAAGDVFSPSTFLTNWNKMTPQAKGLLVPGDVRAELDKLAEVADAAKRGGAERNFSNTGTIAGWLATLGPVIATADGGTLATIAGVVGAQVISAKAMTNPTFLRALNTAARGDARAMRRLASNNGAFTRDAATVLQIMGAEAAVGADAANANTRPVQQILTNAQ